MKHSKTFSAAFLALAVLGLSACDRPAVVNTPTTVVPVPVAVPGPPGPAGPAGPAGEAGTPGAKGNTGDTLVILPPAAPASQ